MLTFVTYAHAYLCICRRAEALYAKRSFAYALADELGYLRILFIWLHDAKFTPKNRGNNMFQKSRFFRWRQQTGLVFSYEIPLVVDEEKKYTLGGF